MKVIYEKVIHHLIFIGVGFKKINICQMKFVVNVVAFIRSVTANINNTVTKINFHVLKDCYRISALINKIHIYSIPPVLIASMCNILYEFI